MGIHIKEHRTAIINLNDAEDAADGLFNKDNCTLQLSKKTFDDFKKTIPTEFKRERNQTINCYNISFDESRIFIKSDYYVGIDWIGTENKRFIYVEPKINPSVVEAFIKVTDEESETLSNEKIEEYDKEAEKNVRKDSCSKELNVIGMLLEAMSNHATAKHTNHLLFVDWESAEIPTSQTQDLLTPFLVVRFLKLLQEIVRKGLKKSYYKVEENLNNRVRGKILVGKQIKQNIFKNRVTSTVCEYQVFGENSIENRFLNKVFIFSTHYVENNPKFFNDNNNIAWLINYIRPAFEHINNDVNTQEIKNLKYNPFFKEYQEAIKIGQYILKRFSYNITKTATVTETISTPPFWIDMPKLFELYVYAKLLKDNPNLSERNFNYQFSTHGNALDFLVYDNEIKIVVDAKYKLHYNYNKVHSDIRQVAGYARLNKVREKLKMNDSNEEIPCLIIYPEYLTNQSEAKLEIQNLLKDRISTYHNIYKFGISLPLNAE